MLKLNQSTFAEGSVKVSHQLAVDLKERDANTSFLDLQLAH